MTGAAAAILAGLALAPATARGDVAELDRKIQALVAEPGDAVQVGIWFGPAGAPIYQLAADTTLPAASVVKTAILIELFAAHAGHLDDPLGAAADAIVADDKHPAMTPFSAVQRGEIRGALHGATVSTIGAIMMGSQKASNAVYNAAANLAIASLGGPGDATAKIHARDPAFAGIAVGRYMLASRTASDNAATPASLAAVLASIAAGKLAGVDAATASAVANAMMHGKDALGVDHHKEGNLDSDPMVCIKTGYYARGDGKPPVVYVVGAALSAKPSTSRDAAHRRLDKLTGSLHAALRAAIR
jgi:hypothetical protein